MTDIYDVRDKNGLIIYQCIDKIWYRIVDHIIEKDNKLYFYKNGKNSKRDNIIKIIER